MPEAILETRELTRYFGGLAAVREVSVDLQRRASCTP